MELTDVYNARTFGVWIGTPRHRSMYVNMSFNSSDYYNFSQKYVGNNRSFSLWSTARPNDHLELDLDINYVQSFDPEGDTDGRFWTGSIRTTYLFNKDVFLRIFAQTGLSRTYYDQDQTHRTYLVSGLLGWEFLPRSNLFLAYNEDGSASDGHFKLNNRALVVKVSYLLSL